MENGISFVNKQLFWWSASITLDNNNGVLYMLYVMKSHVFLCLLINVSVDHHVSEFSMHLDLSYISLDSLNTNISISYNVKHLL